MRKSLCNFLRPTLAGVVAMFAVLIAFAAFAQDATPAPDPAAAPDPMALIQQLFTMFGTFKSGGAVAGAIVLVNLLMNVLKIPWLKEKLSVKPWVLPLVSTLLPGGLAFLGALAMHTPLMGALMAGLTAGLGATGLHELVSVFNSNKQAERAAGATLLAAVQAGDASAHTAVSALHAQLDDIQKLPDDASKAAALALWAKDHAPA